MNKLKRLSCLACMILFGLKGFSQNSYRYNIDLSKLSNDALTVELTTPPVKQSKAVFAFPKIIPGTYSIADYGKFISDVKASDASGKELKVKRVNDNQWSIEGANRLAKITYKVDDIYDATQKHKVYPMAATNFEEGKDFVLNLPGVIGFIEGIRNVPFKVSIQKPAGMYASTSLKPASTAADKDVFEAANLDALYDYPIMYSNPDTASVAVGNCQVLVSVYSPNKKIHAKQVADWMSNLLDAARQYLGGKLPADRYAFIYYFKDPSLKQSFPAGLGGALEHTTSSFYYLPEIPAEQIGDLIVDVSSHEFFHIITPLTIASKEVKEFNFDSAVMSKHLWLYEGVTEYTAHHVQVKYGLNTVQQFLDKLSGKITNSRTAYNDSLPFTELSKGAADKYADEYNNVYQKGALIAACLDIYLLNLSNGTYGLRNLTYDLGVRFGKYRYFNDDELFDNIAELTYPEVKDFLVKYVAGPTPIPYDEFFGMAGVSFTAKAERKVYSFGNIQLVPNEKNVISIGAPFKPNEFGKKMGYKQGDEIYSFNGIEVSGSNIAQVVNDVKSKMKEGDDFTVKIGRKNASNTIDTMTLTQKVSQVTESDVNKLALMENPTPKQSLVQKAWLTAKTDEVKARPVADPNDVASIDAIIKTTYDVISGPAGDRNWNRFLSLFLPEGRMGAIGNDKNGKPVFHAITPEKYIKSNAPFFKQSAFYEEELNRSVAQFGNVATVQSAYQYRLSKDGKIEQRGVNYFSLVKSGDRWYISDLNWQDEEKDLPLPATMLKK